VLHLLANFANDFVDRGAAALSLPLVAVGSHAGSILLLADEMSGSAVRGDFVGEPALQLVSPHRDDRRH
jgi:hypothetical protein